MNILIAVKKDEGYLSPSETFLKLHISKIDGVTEALIGNPGRRRFHFSGKPLIPDNIAYKAIKNVSRKVIGETHPFSDTQVLTRYLKNNNIDLVLAEYGSTAVEIMEACKRASVRLVAHFHGWDAYADEMLDAYQDQYKQLFKQAAGVIAVSKHMKGQLQKLGCPEKKIAVIPCGADINTQLTRTGQSKQIRNFILVGRLTPKKAPLVSLKAFHEIVKTTPDAKLHIVGDGPLKAELDDYIAQHNLADSVVFHGAQAHDYVINQLQQADCFLQHSVVAANGDHEGTPVSVLEAMLLGLPTIATRHAGINDVIIHGQTGFMVDEHDIEEMVMQMRFVVAHPETAFKVGSKAREHIKKHHTAAMNIRNIETMLCSLVD